MSTRKIVEALRDSVDTDVAREWAELILEGYSESLDENVLGWTWAFYPSGSEKLYLGDIVYGTREEALEEGAGGPAYLIKLVIDKE